MKRLPNRNILKIGISPWFKSIYYSLQEILTKHINSNGHINCRYDIYISARSRQLSEHSRAIVKFWIRPLRERRITRWPWWRLIFIINQPVASCSFRFVSRLRKRKRNDNKGLLAEWRGPKNLHARLRTLLIHWPYKADNSSLYRSAGFKPTRRLCFADTLSAPLIWHRWRSANTGVSSRNCR